jgi:histidinol dehydrogenase
MRCELVSLKGRDAAALAAELRALLPAAEEVAPAVAEIIERVRGKGDEAVSEYTRVLDTGGRGPLPLRVATSEVTDAAKTLDPTVRRGLELAIDNVRRVAEAQRPQEAVVDLGTHVVTVREVPVGSAAVYVPGGRAPYPSTVVMGAVTATAAGVHEVIVCSPPGRSGELHPAVLGAAGLTGVSAVYRMGGAQSVAALAYGTESVSAVDVIVGPGNIYVQEAKRQVSNSVGIDGFAGPSDLAVVVGDRADLDLIELDLLAQAEHGEGTMVVAISSRRGLLAELHARLLDAPDTGAVARLVEVGDAAQAVAVVDAIAPEHLELIGEDVEALAPRITRAGCVFVGEASATAFGDYITGSNHILPTAGSARFASALSPADFRRRFYEVAVRTPDRLAQAAAPLARAEGFELHARSMEARCTTARPSKTDHP